MEIYSMLDYNTIFFAECQDGNGFLFHFINFAQTQVIFYSKLTSKNIPFFCFICAVVFNRDHCGESCAPSRNSSPSQKFFSLFLVATTCLARRRSPAVRQVEMPVCSAKSIASPSLLRPRKTLQRMGRSLPPLQARRASTVFCPSKT